MTNGVLKIKEEYLAEAEREAEELVRINYNFLKQKLTGHVTSSSIGIEKYKQVLINEIKSILAIEKSLIYIDETNKELSKIEPENPYGVKDILSKYDDALKESEEKNGLTKTEEKVHKIKFDYAMLGGYGSAYLELQEEIENPKNTELLQKCNDTIGKIKIILPDSIKSLLIKDKIYIEKILDLLKSNGIIKDKDDMDFGILFAKYIITKLRYDLQIEELKKINSGDKTLKKLRELRLQLNGLTLVDMEVENTKTHSKIGDSKSGAPLVSEIETVEWDEVIGQNEAKKTLKDSVVRFLGTYNHSDKESIFEKVLGTKPPKAILLFGPPGTGKTYILKAVITEAERIRKEMIKTNKLDPNLPGHNKRIHFNIITPDQIKDKYIGESSKAIKAVFNQARKEAPSLLIIDELDALFSKRGDSGFNEGEREIVSILLQELEGLKESTGYILVGITNMPKSVDKAILSRFDKKIEFFAPKNDEEVTQLFKVYLKNLIERKAIPKLNPKDWKTLGDKGYDLKFTGRLVKQFVKSLEQERNDILTGLYKDNESIVKDYYDDPAKMKKRLNQKSKKFTINYICKRMAEFASHTQHSETYSL